MSNESKIFTSPVGRLVGGSVSKLREKRDRKNQPILDKDDHPKVECSFGVAFPKTGPYGANGETITTTHFSQLGEMGAAMWAIGNAAHPAAAQRLDFSWKVTDGDSAVPNRADNKPCENEGYPGNWVIWFSGSYLPETCDAKGSTRIDAEQIKLGHFVQIAGSTKGNTGDSPGIYMNHSAVAHTGFGPEISTGIDIASAGFGKAPLPAGVSAIPTAALVPPPVRGAPPVAPPVAQATPAVAAPPPPAAPPIVVQPHTGFLTPPPPAAAVAPPPPPAGPQMTAAAQAPYAQYIASGWNDAQLRSAGLMI